MNKNEVLEIDQNESNDKNEDTTKQTSRRNFIGKVGGFGLAAAVLGVTNSPKEIFAQEQRVPRLPPLSNIFRRRATEAFNLRNEAAKLAFQATELQHSVNGDEVYI